MKIRFLRPFAGVAALLMLNPELAYSQTQPAPAPAPAQAPAAPAATATPQAPVFKQEELDQMLAPIALYPDPLIAQILMASSYPLQVVQADRWLKDPKNAAIKGSDLENALQPLPWDPSVKSLIPFPQVLDMMSQQLDWTQKLGDAVLAQEADVMASIQRLRHQAQDAGKLETNQQQTVTMEGSGQTQNIIIQPANPQTVYVPAYDPQVVYGTWPYPSYPPAYYPPPYGYYPGQALLTGMAFAAGVAIVGGMWGWGDCNWSGGSVNINNNNTFNNINRGNIDRGRASQLPANGRGNWQHNPQNRGGVAYRDQKSRQNYGRASQQPASSRQDFRGRDQGAGNRPSQGAIGQGGANRPSQGAIGQGGANRPSQGGVGQGAGNRPSQGGVGQGAGNRPSAGARPAQQPSAFGGMNNGRGAAAQADRGRASRQTMSRGGGASRGGGGGSRGGGGGRRR